MADWWRPGVVSGATRALRCLWHEADAAWYLLPAAFAPVVVPLSRVRLSRVSASDVPPGRFVCLFVCLFANLSADHPTPGCKSVPLLLWRHRRSA
eukprot:5753661-Prymnesium_polylepis.1